MAWNATKSKGISSRQSLVDSLVEERFKKDATVVKEGDKGHKFYFIEKGEAKAMKNMSMLCWFNSRWQRQGGLEVWTRRLLRRTGTIGQRERHQESHDRSGYRPDTHGC